MDSTTLVSFLFQTSREVRDVELFGSWDNFSTGHRMHKDPHKGHGYWTGCHRFENIVCDGVRPNWSKPRSGALKQGGLYWYYYKLDDEEECCNPFQPSTSFCPLLPGQTVNVMEVPTEFIAPPSRVSSADAILAAFPIPPMTLDPADRYKKIYRKHPTKLPRFYCSSDAIREKAADQPSSIMNSGGAVQSLSPSTSHKSLKRCRSPCVQSPQQSESYKVKSRAAEMKAIVLSISVNIPEANRLPELRPFGPMPDFQSDARPTTRYGAVNGPSVGLGLSIPQSFDSYSTAPSSFSNTFPSSAELEPSALQDATAHPHPLRAHPASSVVSPISPTWASFPYSPLTTSSFLVSPIDDYRPTYTFERNNNNNTPGNGINDMVSPTFTAETMSSEEEQETPVEDFQLTPTDYLSGALTTVAPAQKYKYTTNYDQYRHNNNSSRGSGSGSSTYSGQMPQTSAQAVQDALTSIGIKLAASNASSATLRPLNNESKNVDMAVAADGAYCSFPEFRSSSSRPMTLDEEVLVDGDDFASAVFGALGFEG